MTNDTLYTLEGRICLDDLWERVTFPETSCTPEENKEALAKIFFAETKRQRLEQKISSAPILSPHGTYDL